ncbi:MAG: carboxypeptidase regulatory-like domain-containing protein [Planctomycetes bacterium]|nr:carboxypeptidase regulatory-like domain-containing protein [Planctomycetota bacterium]
MPNLVTNEEGTLLLELAAKIDGVIASSNDSRHYFGQATYLLSHELDEIELVVESLVTVELSASYDDGLAYTGRVGCFGNSIRPTVSDENGNWKSGGNEFSVETTPCPLDGIRCTDFRLIFRSTRPGYGNYVESIEASQIYEGARINVIITPSKTPTGGLELDFGDQTWEQGEPWYYEVLDLTRDMPGKNAARMNHPPQDNKHLVTPLLDHEFSVRVTYKDLVWQSVVSIERGKNTTAKVEFTTGCTAGVTLLDEQGNPLYGAVIHLDSGSYEDYPATTLAGSRGVSREDGRAIIEGVSSDVRTLVVEAQGFEPQTVNVVLSPGMLSDIGPIHLTRAEGVVTVRLLNRRPDCGYTVMLIHPAGKGGKSTRTNVPVSGEMVFEALPLRAYMIATTYEEGGRIVSQNITLSEETKSAVVELDVGSLPEPTGK